MAMTLPTTTIRIRAQLTTGETTVLLDTDDVVAGYTAYREIDIASEEMMIYAETLRQGHVQSFSYKTVTPAGILFKDDREIPW